MGRRTRARNWDGLNDSGRRASGPACTKKTRYETESEALAALRRIRQSADWSKAEMERLPIAVRECDGCGAYHLTGVLTKPAKPGQRRRRRKGGMGWK